jgi:hypothetical protein
MQLPNEQNPIWQELVKRENHHNFDFLAATLLLGKLNLKCRLDKSPQEMERSIHELRSFFERNSHLPKVQNDLRRVFGEGLIMNQEMFDVATIKEYIQNGEKFILAGDEKILSILPAGAWIGGTIPYFMTDDGGMFTQEKIYATRMPDDATNIVIRTYDASTIHQIYLDAPANGFSIIILPAFSSVHTSFALNSPTYEGFATKPLIGWVSGVSLDELGQSAPKTFDGANPGYEDKAVVFHIELPSHKAADIQIINIFQPGDGDTITFPTDGFQAKDVYVNGTKMNFATYIEQNNIDTRLPLVTDMFGAMINTSFRQINSAEKTVSFYAPVFDGIEYKIAKPINDYVTDFEAMVPNNLGDAIFFSCNCILNYRYANLEGKSLQGITGPMTFGEIAYQLLNQTMAYVVIEDIE